MIGFLLAPVAHLLAPAIVNANEVSTMNVTRIIFLMFAGMAVAGAISTIARRNDIAAVMSLVGTFFALAAVYTFLSAHFIAVLQVLVYAGAIMVLFIFVVMVLNRDETDPWVWRGVVGKVVFGVVPIVGLTIYLSQYLRMVGNGNTSAPDEQFGTVAQIGELLFTDYLFAFEAVSVLLMIAVIAAVVVARTHKHAEAAHDAGPKPEHRFSNDPHTGALYSATVVPTPPGGGHH